VDGLALIQCGNDPLGIFAIMDVNRLIHEGYLVLRNVKKLTILGLSLVGANSFSATEIIDGHLGALSNQASQQVGNVPGNRYNADFEFKYHRSTNSSYRRELERKFHVAALMNDQNLTMFSVQEAYVGGNLSSKDHLRFGRQILSWSDVDKMWGFGKLNNRRNFDYFTPGQEGLHGLLYERKSSNGMRYKSFLSGLYIPEMNPGLDIDKKNQTITSRHPWSDAPAQTAQVEGTMMDVKYDVQYPNISDVIFRYSVGANIGWENKNWVFDNFYMRKPENSITPNVEVNVDFVQRTVNAQIDPRFYYHDVYGSSLKYRNHDVEMYISGIAIRPNEYPDVDARVRYTEIKNKKRREDYVGGGISRSNDLYTVAFNYVARLSPFDRNKDELTQDPRWNQALNLLGQRNFGRHYSLSADLKYDMLTTDRLLMFRGNYKVSKDLLMNVGMNMIGTPTNGKSYWSPYTNNDAIYGGLRYVF
jgi:hypothetical protein